MQKWEYQIETVIANKESIADLNLLGSLGWELVTTYKNGNDIHSTFIYKRPLV
jgi:hypothetical protein